MSSGEIRHLFNKWGDCHAVGNDCHLPLEIPCGWWLPDTMVCRKHRIKHLLNDVYIVFSILLLESNSDLLKLHFQTNVWDLCICFCKIYYWYLLFWNISLLTLSLWTGIWHYFRDTLSGIVRGQQSLRQIFGNSVLLHCTNLLPNYVRVAPSCNRVVRVEVHSGGNGTMRGGWRGSVDLVQIGFTPKYIIDLKLSEIPCYIGHCSFSSCSVESVAFLCS